MRYWVFFRMGHGTYLALGLSFLNFIVLQYRLLIENIPALQSAFPHLKSFGIIFVLIYVPIAIVIGWLDYRKGSVTTDSVLRVEANPFTMDMTESNIMASQGFLALLKGDYEGAMSLTQESIDLRKKWARK